VRHTGLDTVPRPEAWRPLGAVGWPNLALVVRGKVPAAALAAPVREAVWGLDRELPIVHLQPMEERLQSSLGLRKFALGLLSIMALVALLLATAGIYGVTAYMVAQRTRELGVRLALGATPKRLTALLIGEMVPVVALGSLIGLAAGASLSRLLRGFLFGVAPVDAGTYAVLTLLLAAATCAATAAAAVRASAVDPAEALRAT
jgi:putative ABC transport system permease protein